MPTVSKSIDMQPQFNVAVFGATGTIGDGLLKAAMSSDEVDRIFVVTRRPSLRIEKGIEAGKIVMTIHTDYLDYSEIREILAQVDAVFWAIGLSAVGMDQASYREIHVSFPKEFVGEWLRSSDNDQRTFHYVSGSGAKADSQMMWAREKAEAETVLTELAQNSKMRVISYRPAFILPTELEVNFGQKIMHFLFDPIGFSVRAEAIGQAMLELSAGSQQFENGLILENADIRSLSKAYISRKGLATRENARNQRKQGNVKR